MLENKFDEIFRNKLLGHTSQVPEDMWERIRQKDKSRKPFPFWPWRIIGPALLILGLTGAYFLIQPVNKRSNTPIPERNLKNPEYAENPETPGNPETPRKPETSKDPNSPEYPKNRKSSNVRKNNKGVTSNRVNTKGGNSKKDISIESNTRKTNKVITAETNTIQSKPVGIKHNRTNRPHHTSYSALTYPVDKAGLYHLDSTFSGNKKTIIQSSPIKETINRKGDSLVHRKALPDSKTLFQKGKDWHLDIYISPDAPFQTITANYTPGPELLQKGQLSYTAGLKVSKSFTSHFTGQIGVQYSRINIKLSKSDTLVTLSGDRQLNSLDIPILIGYEMGNDRFKMAINTGVILNAYSWYKGNYSAANGKLYRQNTGTSLYLGLCFTHALNEKFSLFAEPYFRFRTSDMTNEHQVFSQKINTLGLSIGLRYNFNGNRQHK